MPDEEMVMAKDDNDFYLSFRVWGAFVRSRNSNRMCERRRERICPPHRSIVQRVTGHIAWPGLTPSEISRWCWCSATISSTVCRELWIEYAHKITANYSVAQTRIGQSPSPSTTQRINGWILSQPQVLEFLLSAQSHLQPPSESVRGRWMDGSEWW